MAGLEGQTGQVAYSASKGGIIGMTVPAARDLAAIGVRVNTICPGIIDTPIYGTGEGSEEWKARLAAPVVFPKRMGTAAEFAQLVRSLIENDYMNAEPSVSTGESDSSRNERSVMTEPADRPY